MPRLRSAWLTMADPGDFVIDADLGIAPLEELGWDVVVQPWRERDVDWSACDAVYIGTPWDYPDDVDTFLDVLAAIDSSGAILVNPLELVHWNLDKRYLADLEERGADIVPTTWLDAFDDDAIDDAFTHAGGQALVIKPRVGANAVDTFVLERPLDAALRSDLARVFANRPCMLQPFVAAVREEGEYSLFFLDGELSHAILKKPAHGDFRVQEEHGAAIVSASPEPALAAAARAVADLVEPAPAYARADFVRGDNGRYLLMELELIEPSLYLRMDPLAPGRFAAAFDSYARRLMADRERRKISERAGD